MYVDIFSGLKNPITSNISAPVKVFTFEDLAATRKIVPQYPQFDLLNAANKIGSAVVLNPMLNISKGVAEFNSNVQKAQSAATGSFTGAAVGSLAVTMIGPALLLGLGYLIAKKRKLL